MIGFLQAEPSAATLRAALDSVFAGRAYRWAETPPALRIMREWWDRLGTWLESLRLGNPAAFRLFVFALLVALVLVLAHGAWVVWRTVRGASAPDDGAPSSGSRERRDAAWYLGEADRAAAAGRMADALQLAFVGLALTLDGQGLLRYHASQTPAEVARAARLAAQDRERLRALVQGLYGYVFGGRPCAPEDYRRWRATSAGPWHAAAH
ncbi:MAG: DUF4129 domain-containing protein [Gemmatimonadales bacterium]